MYVGIDVGTSVTKAVAFDTSGRETAAASVPTRLHNPHPGHYEHDVAEVFDAVADVVRRVTETETPAAVGITAQGDGLWLLDEEGRPVRPAVSWLDARAEPVLRRWMAAGAADEVFDRCGGMMFPGAAAPILAFLAESEPESLGRATTAGYCKDAVMQWLTGVRATDVSDASMPFVDAETGDYSAAALDACGLAEWRHLLAPVSSPQGPTAPLREGAGVGLPAGVPVSSGPYDLPASAAGAGVEAPGDALVTIGTTLACQVVTDSPAHRGERAGLLLGTWRPDRRLRAMPSMVGTAALEGLLGLIRASADELPELLAQSPPGARGVTVLPFWSAAGERAPFLEPGARGSIDGIDLATTSADLVRAMCEAVAYAARHCLEAAGWSGRVTVCGGGARSAEWLEIFAAVLGAPLHIAPGAEVGARGAVIGAAQALGHPIDLEEWTRPARVHEPDPDLAAYYEDGYRRYVERVAAARERWRTCAAATMKGASSP